MKWRKSELTNSSSYSSTKLHAPRARKPCSFDGGVAKCWLELYSYHFMTLHTCYSHTCKQKYKGLYFSPHLESSWASAAGLQAVRMHVRCVHVCGEEWRGRIGCACTKVASCKRRVVRLMIRPSSAVLAKQATLDDLVVFRPGLLPADIHDRYPRRSILPSSA